MDDAKFTVMMHISAAHIYIMFGRSFMTAKIIKILIHNHVVYSFSLKVISILLRYRFYYITKLFYKRGCFL
jgi:hypothetical protein